MLQHVLHLFARVHERAKVKDGDLDALGKWHVNLMNGLLYTILLGLPSTLGTVIV